MKSFPRSTPAHAALQRRWLVGAGGLALGLGLAGCGSIPPDPPLLHLAGAVAVTTGPALARPPRADAQPWRLVVPVKIPTALDRNAVMVSPAAGRLEPWQNLRWSEPLADSVAQLLVADLSSLRGVPVWAGRVPDGNPSAPSLQVDILSWEARSYDAQVALTARWVLSSPARSGELRLTQPWQPLTADGLARAQRQILRNLAEKIWMEADARP